jgi:hypothetical protein
MENVPRESVSDHLGFRKGDHDERDELDKKLARTLSIFNFVGSRSNPSTGFAPVPFSLRCLPHLARLTIQSWMFFFRQFVNDTCEPFRELRLCCLPAIMHLLDTLHSYQPRTSDDLKSDALFAVFRRSSPIYRKSSALAKLKPLLILFWGWIGLKNNIVLCKSYIKMSIYFRVHGVKGKY